MTVFLVMELNDYEYGCREVSALFERYEDAEEYIENVGNQEEITFWHGGKAMYYTIAEWQVQ